MLSTNRNVSADVTVNVTGQSTVDDEIVARYSAHVSPDEDKIAITTVIYDKDKYKSECAGDESEFEDNVFDSEKQIMDKREEILGVFNPESDDEPEDEQEEPDDESGDDDSKTGAGNEETIIP